MKLQGYENQIFYGPAGATAQTPLLNIVDVEDTLNHEYGDTTVKGVGTSVPIKSARPVSREVPLTFSMKYVTTDAGLAYLLAAARAATPVAIRTKSYASGTGVDADFYLTFRHRKPLSGEQVVEFTGTATDELRAINPGA